MRAALPVLSEGMTPGLIALAAALVLATVLGFTLRRRAGRFRVFGTRPAQAGIGTGADVLTEADLGGRLGERATLVQFSTPFCAPCRPTRDMLTRVAGTVEGVTHIEIDAAARLDLARRLRVTSTPTVLVLGPGGGIVSRASGQPRQADVMAALGTAIAPGRPGASVAPGPASGTPASGTPASGTSASGTSASGTSASGTPASGTPASGTPASGTPAFGVGGE
jgi:thiol-disulfide isomerase/thioredoxin